jgi:hypothetical protein
VMMMVNLAGALTLVLADDADGSAHSGSQDEE